MTLRSLLPRGMVGRIALVLLVALALEFAGNVFLFERSERAILSGDRAQRIADQLVVAERLAQAAAPGVRAALMRNLRTPHMTLNWVPATVITDAARTRPQLAQTKDHLLAAAPQLAARDLRLNIIRSDQSAVRDMIGAMRLADGSFITFRVAGFQAAPPGLGATVLLHLLLVAGVVCIALLAVRALIDPLRRLASAADRAGHGTPVPIAVRGPREVRQVAEAFGAMQDRLMRVVTDHTEALVALSHDLRTPIQRLRLRASLLDDGPARDAMAGDLDDMEKFVGSVLAYMRGGEEDARLIDLAAMVSTIVDQAADGGADIAYAGPETLDETIRPLAFKRAVSNLVENAVRHAGRVRVSLSATRAHITLTVEDDGPGIPAAERANALLPFHRLEKSRNPSSGGAGLGLAIVARSAVALDGELVLEDSPLGGLAARLRWPAKIPDPATHTA